MITDSQLLISGHAGKGTKTFGARGVYAIPTFPGAIPEAGTFYVDLAGVFKPSATNIGAFIQASAPVSVRMTMASADETKRNPTGVVWSPSVAVPANVIKLIAGADGNPLVGSMLEITTAAPTRLYVGSL